MFMEDGFSLTYLRSKHGEGLKGENYKRKLENIFFPAIITVLVPGASKRQRQVP